MRTCAICGSTCEACVGAQEQIFNIEDIAAPHVIDTPFLPGDLIKRKGEEFVYLFTQEDGRIVAKSNKQIFILYAKECEKY